MVAIAALYDQLKCRALILQAMGCKAKTSSTFLCNFPHTLRKLDVIASNSDCFIVLFASVVICWSNYFGIFFFNSHLKTALLILSDKF